jgi:hypothetical protein
VGVFALAAVLPLLPYLGVLLRGVPRYNVVADFALIEQYTRHVFTGETLLGLKSRFDWHHPGPLYFYFVAPFEVLFGDSSTGLYLGSWVLVALAVGSFAALTRISSGRRCSVVVLIGLAAWFDAFGDAATNPWGRLIGVVPLLVTVGFAALVARGMIYALYPMIFFGALAAQTHVSTVTTVGAVGTGAVASFVIRSRRRGSLPADGRHLAACAGFVLLAVAPMLIEEFHPVHGEGNITRLAHFFMHRPEPLRPYASAFRDWGVATSWLPGRLLGRELRAEGGLPLMMRWDDVSIQWTGSARWLTAAHVAAAVVAFGVSLRRRDVPSLAFLASGALGELVAMDSLRAIVGSDQYSLVFWVAAPCAVTWMGVMSTVASWFAARATAPPAMARVATRCAAMTASTLLCLTTADQRDWTLRNAQAPMTMPWLARDLREFVGDIERQLSRTGAVPVIHLAGAWWLGAAVALELEKDGVDVRYGSGEMSMFAGARSASGIARPLHLWFRAPEHALAVAPCIDRIAVEGKCEAFGATHDVTSCNMN